MWIYYFRKRPKEEATGVRDMKELSSKKELLSITIHSVIQHGR